MKNKQPLGPDQTTIEGRKTTSISKKRKKRGLIITAILTIAGAVLGIKEYNNNNNNMI